MIFRRSFLAVAACALPLPVLAASHPAGRGGSVHLATQLFPRVFLRQ